MGDKWATKNRAITFVSLRHEVLLVEGSHLNKRIESTLSLLSKSPVLVEELNLALRALFKQIIVDYKEYCLRFVWHSGQESSELYLHEWPKG